MSVKDKEEKEELGRENLTCKRRIRKKENWLVSDFNTVLRKLWPGWWRVLEQQFSIRGAPHPTRMDSISIPTVSVIGREHSFHANSGGLREVVAGAVSKAGSLRRRSGHHMWSTELLVIWPQSTSFSSYANTVSSLSSSDIGLVFPWITQAYSEFSYFDLAVPFAWKIVSKFSHKLFLLIIQVKNSKDILLPYSRGRWGLLHLN